MSATCTEVLAVRYSRLGYVALNVSDLRGASAWYEFVVGLKPSRRPFDGSFHFDIGTNRDGLLLFESQRPGLKRIGWTLEDAAQIPALSKQLEAHGLTWHTLAADDR